MLFVGDDWAEDHHDIEIQDQAGRRLATARLAEGIEGIARLHALIGAHLAEDAAPEQVAVAIETDRGLWVQALGAAGYQVYAINPLQAARARGRGGVSGAKSDAADAHSLADLVRTDHHQLRVVAGDSELAGAVKITARTHQRLIWEQTRHTLRLRSELREFFPAALDAFSDLTAPEALELLARAPDPATAATLTGSQIRAVLKRAGRRPSTLSGHTQRIKTAFGTPQLGQPAVITSAYAASVRAQVAVLSTLRGEISRMQEHLAAHFGAHPDAEIVTSQPGLGVVLGARVLAEFGDDPTRYASAKARKNYAATSPITRSSGKKELVTARWVHNDRLVDALGRQAFTAIRTSPGARAYYQRQRARGIGHHAALRQVANRLVGILHGCLKTRRPYNETIAWSHHAHQVNHDDSTAAA